MLYIDHEMWRIGADIDELPALLDEIPGMRSNTIYCDSARPETISYLARHGYTRATRVEKWSGSIEDGINFLRQFRRIIVHPSCKHTLDECRSYSYKVDRLTGEVLPQAQDRDNHLIDSLRYALSPLIREPVGSFFSSSSFLIRSQLPDGSLIDQAPELPRVVDFVFAAIATSRRAELNATAIQIAFIQQERSFGREASARVGDLIIALYHQKLTYGEFAHKRYEIGRDAAAAELAFRQSALDQDQQRLMQAQQLAQQQFANSLAAWSTYMQAVNARQPQTVHIKETIRVQ